MKIGIAGHKSAIAKAFIALRSSHEFVTERCDAMPLDCDAYLICAGFLAGRTLAATPTSVLNRTWNNNFTEIAILCDRVLETNDHARICVIGSESGIAGSYDMCYAGAKAALHLYVRTKRLRTPHQQLICLAPGIIGDSGMTQRRHDQATVTARAAAHRARRHISAREVAQVAVAALFGLSPFLSNTIIELGGDVR